MMSLVSEGAALPFPHVSCARSVGWMEQITVEASSPAKSAKVL